MAPASDSDDDRLPSAPKAPRQKRFRFKTFAERVAELEVDVYRSLAPVKAEPAGGSWLADALAHWRELNSAAHFLQVAAALQPLCQSLPQLLHHREDVAGILLGSVEPEARLSLQALLALLVAFARDLQHEFVPMLPRVVRRLVALLEGGADREPEVLEAVFTCLSLICKYLASHLAADLPLALRVTAPLRYYRADYVRQFAAQAVGFLLRSAPSAAALRVAVRTVLAEQAARPTEERTDGAGLVLAETMLGVSHGLHSRAPQLLQLVLREDLLAPTDLRPAARDGAVAAAFNPLSQEQLRAYAAAVAQVVVSRVLEHVRRGKAGELWSTLLAETTSRLRAYESAAAGLRMSSHASLAAGQNSAETTAAARSLGRAVLLLAQAVAYFRGSRVESYQPLLDLARRLMQPCIWSQASVAALAQESGSPGSASAALSDNPSPRSADDELDGAALSTDHVACREFLRVSLCAAVLELVRSLVYGHLKAVGASEGPAALARCAPAWAPCFARPPADEVLPFVKALMVPPVSAEVMRIFAPHMLGCLGRLLQDSPSAQLHAEQLPTAADAGAGDGGQPMASQQQALHVGTTDSAGAALLLLRDLCALLRPYESSAPRSALPLLLTAQPGGVRLAAHVRSLATAWQQAPERGEQQLARAWAAVALLPHACELKSQAVDVCVRVLEVTRTALELPPVTAQPGGGATSGAASAGVLLLRATATEVLADMLHDADAHSEQGEGGTPSLTEAAAESLQWLLGRQRRQRLAALGERGCEGQDAVQHGADLASVRAAGALLSAVRARLDSGTAAPDESALLSEAQLRQHLPILAPLLGDSSQQLRAATLRLLCCFDQPPLEELGPDKSDPTSALHSKSAAAAARAGPKCDLLTVLHEINSRPLTIEAGRKWAVALGRLKTYMEYERIPDVLVPSFVYGLVGILHVRFSPLWQPASEALATCLHKRTKVSWPIMYGFLAASQRELLEHEGSPTRAYRLTGQRDTPEGQVPTAHDPSVIEALEERFAAALHGQAGGASGTTDPQNRLSHALRALAAAPYSLVEKHAKDWVPLFLDYTAARGSQFDYGDADLEPALEAANGSAALPSSAAGARGGGDDDDPGAQAGRPAKRARKGASAAPACAPTGEGVPSEAQDSSAKPKPGVLSRIGGKTWRAGLLDWLKLLAGLHGVRGLHRSDEVQQAVSTHLLEADSGVQVAALRCLRMYRFRWLPADMAERLGRLASDATLREELAIFPVAHDAEGGVGEDARPGLIPLLVRVLFPKMRKRSGRLGGRGASGSARVAILNFLACLRPKELRPLLELLLEPLAAAFVRPPAHAHGGYQPGGAAAEAEAEEHDRWRLVAPAWWSAPMLGRSLAWWLAAVDQEQLGRMPSRRKVGFLNAFEDLLAHVGHGVEPFLPTLLAITLRLLAPATAHISATSGPGGVVGAGGPDAEEPGADGEDELRADGSPTAPAALGAEGPLAAVERHREVRNTSLRLLAQVLLRFPACSSADFNDMWGVFLPAVQPLIPRLQWEAASTKEPPLLECILSLSLSPGLVRVLGDLPSVPDATVPLVRVGAAPAAALAVQTAPVANGVAGMEVDPPTAAAEWQLHGYGSALLRGMMAMLRSGRCTEIVRATALDVLDSVLGCGERILRLVLLPGIADVLQALHAVVADAWEHKGSSSSKGSQRGAGKRSATCGAHRELAILERLGVYVSDPALARSLADSLVALLMRAGNRALRKRSSGRAAKLDEAGISRALGALAALWGRLEAGHLPEESVHRYCEVMSMWAIRLHGREARAMLAAAYAAVARLMPRMALTAELLTELTAWSPTALDEADYDRRLGAYGRLAPGTWRRMGRLEALPLLLATLHDLRNAADLALRQASAASLSNLIAALVAEEEAAAAPDEAHADSDDSLLRLAGRVLYPQIKSQLSSNSLAVRQEHLSLLRALAAGLPRRFPDLAVLLSDDPETDFFHNVAHLQSHRRVRALVKLAKSIRAEALPDAAGTPSRAQAATAAALGRCLTDVVVPLLQQFIEEGAGVGGGRDARAHEKKQSDVDKEANVTDAAIGALGAAAGRLAWPQYEQLLNQFIRLMRARPAKPLVRSVCAIIDAFHFSLPQTDAEAAAAEAPAAAAAAAGARVETAAAAETADGVASEEEEEEDDAADDERGRAGAAVAQAADPAVVQRVLLRRILPALQEQLVERKRGEDEDIASVRAPVALALVKLFKLLPPAAERAELPRALQGVANLLSSRLQRVRDDARAVLVSMMAELGPRYLPYACHVLRASLPDRGFTAHVIGYTLHAVLEAVVKVAHGESAAAAAAAAVAEPQDAGDEERAAVGADDDQDDADAAAGVEGDEADQAGSGFLDDSLELCLPLIEADLFGEVSEAKDVAAFASKYKEAKRCRANEAYQLLASGITFSTHARELLSVVTDRLHLAGQPTMRSKLTQLLQFAARGVRSNPTAGPKQVMVLVVRIMDGCLTREEAARARAKAAVGPAGSAAAGLSPAAAAAAAQAREQTDAERAALHEYLVLEWCLTLLHGGVKRGVLAGRSPELMALLDPALPLLVRALRSRHAGCVSLALRTLAHMVPLPLPGLAVEAPAAGSALTALLKKVPSVRHPIAQECFRLLAALLRDCAAYQPTTAQLRFLLRWAFEDLGEAGAQPTSFALLRALLGRRVVLPEVYDVMERVQQIMVRSQSAPVRASCSAALLQFLLDFPLGPARLKQHVAFLLANLEYEYETGRLQVLDALGQVVAKFPAEVLQAQLDVLLMPLVVRLINDASPKARSAAGDVLRSLLGRLEPPQMSKAVGFCRAWLAHGEGGTGALRRAAAQTLGFVAEVEGSRFARRLADLAPAVVQLLEQQADSAGDDATADDESPDSEARCPGWQEAYYCLVLLEKVAAKAGSALAWPAPDGAAAAPSAAQAAACSLAPALWEATVRLLLHPHMWVRRAAARLVGYGLATPGVCGGLMAARAGRAGQLAFAFYLQLECEAADEAMCLQAVKCLVSLSVHLHRQPDPAQPAAQGAGADGAAAPDAGAADDDADAEDDAGDDASMAAQVHRRAFTLRGLVRRMARLADDARWSRARQRTAALRWTAAAATAMGPESIGPHLPVLLRPLYRISEAAAQAGASSAAGGGAQAGQRVDDDVRQLGEEVMAHLRGVVGSEALLAAYNAAREHVRGLRSQRKRRAAMREMVDPAAAAAARLKHNARKAEGRKRKVEVLKREGSAGGWAGRQGGRGKQARRE